MKLWDKDVAHDEAASAFAAAGDAKLDERLLPYDCVASIAHAKGLNAAGIIDDNELSMLTDALVELREMALKGTFSLSPDDEDCHSAIERFLVERLGDTGRKIHTCRSRNDQVLCALRLCYIDELHHIVDSILDLIGALQDVADSRGDVSFAGHTHTRKAMPTTVRDWAQGYIGVLTDSVITIEGVLRLIRSNPLGTGAGYGLPIHTDRRLVADELGLPSIDVNGIYSQLSRAKHEKLMLSGLSSVMYDLNRLASDLILFSHPDLGYFVIDTSMTTGSSIMPQKTNPDALEVIRGYYSVILGNEMQVATVTHNLISGYHRDVQLTKGVVFSSLDTVSSSLAMMGRVVSTLAVSESACEASLSEEIFLTEKAYELVRQGVPFRTAYQRVANDYFSRKGK
ncbi:argininosuccinate lyase [archaeon]|nr:MAG: argininosuccinate lyase [archaeon]